MNPDAILKRLRALQEAPPVAPLHQASVRAAQRAQAATKRPYRVTKTDTGATVRFARGGKAAFERALKKEMPKIDAEVQAHITRTLR